MNPADALAGRVVLEALRLDLEAEDMVRDRADQALELGAGGFIIFGGEAEQVCRLISDLRAAADYPLWFGSDLERGAGQQFSGLPTLPPPAGLAAHRDPSAAATQAGRLTGRAASAVGIDLVFAPVLDLDVEPRNPIVGSRAFSDDPETVARLGAAWIAGCQAEGVLACAKHFPGHGRTIADSHAGIPRVEAGRDELEGDFLPFRRVASDVAAILTAHVSYPGLGTVRPATLAPEILMGLLRTELGFGGLIVSDAMNMSGFLDAEIDGGIDADDGVAAGHPAVAALLAGCDLLLYPADFGVTVEALRCAAEREPEVRRRLEAAIARGAEVRNRFACSPAELDSAELGSAALDSAALALGCVTWSVERPTWLRPTEPIRVLPIWDDREQPGRSPFGAEFVDELRRAGWNVSAHEPDLPVLVLVASTPQAWKGTAGLTPSASSVVETALSNPAGALPVVFGHSRLVAQLGGGVCAWGTELAMERAAARAISATAGVGG